jgi:hypothetical protein
MTLIVLDGSGRMSEFIAVPEPLETDNAPRVMDWEMLFSLAGLDMKTFEPVDPQWVPTTYADERRAWQGPLPEHSGQTFRVEAASMAGRPVSFVLTGPWSRSARASQPLPQSGFSRFLEVTAGLVVPGLMMAAAILAWRNLKAGRGDRRGATRAALVLVALEVVAWVFRSQYTSVIGEDVARFFGAIGVALFDGGLLWLTYLGLEPYVRRFSPGSLIGWTRLLNGRWRDPQVASDILIGIGAGLGMTLFYAVHNFIPPLLGRPEPMPLLPGDTQSLLSARAALGGMLSQLGAAISSGMLAVVGVVTLLIVVRRKWAAHLAGSVIFVWVVIAGMFPSGTPVLDVIIGLGIIGIWTGVILHAGLLSTIAALATHFMLLRAPLTFELSNWRGTPSIAYLLVVGGAGIAAAYLAWRSAPPNYQLPTPR